MTSYFYLYIYTFSLEYTCFEMECVTINRTINQIIVHVVTSDHHFLSYVTYISTMKLLCRLNPVALYIIVSADSRE